MEKRHLCTLRRMKLKVGDLIQHKSDRSMTGLVTKISRDMDNRSYVEAVWSADWLSDRNIEQKYLEVISEGR